MSNTGLFQYSVVFSIFILPHAESRCNSISKCTNANLNCPSIFYQGAYMKTDGVVLYIYWIFRWSKQRIIEFRAMKQNVILFCIINCITIHKRHLFVYLCYNCNFFTICSFHLNRFIRADTDVGIASHGINHFAVDFTASYKLSEYIGAEIDSVPCYMRIAWVERSFQI